jgi:ATP-dependent exoDNAse (exonuclease V) alpha subunit
VLSARTDFVEQYNREQLETLGTKMINYEGFELRKDGSQKKISNTIAVGAKAIITKNMTIGEKSVYNGQRVTVVECNDDSVQVVDEKNNKYTFTFVEEIEDEKIIERFMPVTSCYALTIHKS